MTKYIIKVDPVSKPRMVRSDKWKSRPITDHYWAFKDLLKLHCNKMGLQELPASIEEITFVIPMPKSWPEKERNIMDGKPHCQTPDLDNLIKSLQDCLCSQDKHIWHIGSLSKIWGRTGEIQITI